MGYRNYSVANGFVVDPSGNGDFTTITSAYAAAPSGTTVFVRPGTYSGAITGKANVNISAFGSDGSLNQTGEVIITGTVTMTVAGSMTISGVQLQTASANFLIVSGSAASIVNLNNCNLNCTNNTGITFSSSGAGTTINISNCTGDLGTTGIGLYTMSSTGSLNCYYSILTNSGASTTASSNSAGTVTGEFCDFSFALSTSSSGKVELSYFKSTCNSINTICITTAGTATQTFRNVFLGSGTASALSVGSGTTVDWFGGTAISTNAAAITGAGTFNYQGLMFNRGTQAVVNVTTQTTAGLLLGGTNQAPTAGFIGENIFSNVQNVATTNGVAKSITSISLTAGIWDVSACIESAPTGGTAVLSATGMCIGTTNNTITGTAGYDSIQMSITACPLMSISIPKVRVTLTGTTTYYVVAINYYSSTTCPTHGNISATRVG